MKLLPFLDLEGATLSEASDKYCMISLIRGILKEQTHSQKKKSELWLPQATVEEEGIGWKVPTSNKINKY